MKRNAWRLMMALVISTASFLGTMVWFERGKTEPRKSHRTAMALLGAVTNEVQRKPLQRVIWESLNKNDELYAGEAVRTTPNAEAQLVFMKTGTRIHLEHDSLIVLEENEKGLSLDFLQGNLFVQSAPTPDERQGPGESGEGLTLKTGNGEIKIKSADMSLSKNPNGRIDLEIHRGEAELSQGTKRTVLNKNKSVELSEQGLTVAADPLEILNLTAGETLYLNLANGEKLNVIWKPLPKGYAVTAEIGESRRTLVKIPSLSSPGDSGTLSFKTKPGRLFVRLTATPVTPTIGAVSATVTGSPHLPRLMSFAIPVLIEPKSPPLPVEPRDEASLITTEPGQPVAFKWSTPYTFKAQVFEVAADVKFKTVVLSKSLDGFQEALTVPLTEGNYFWRVTGFLKVKDKNDKEEKTESLSSPSSRFKVSSKREIEPPEPMNKIEWDETAMGNASDYEYNTPTPSLRAVWRALPALPANYRFKVSRTEQAAGNVSWQLTKQTMFDIPVAEEGTFEVVVEALNAKGQVNAQSPVRHFRVKRHPLLPAPQWPNATPQVLKADAKGNLTFGWEQVQGAQNYIMTLELPDGKIIEQKEIKRAMASVNQLKPGQYQVSVRSVDRFQRPSERGEVRKIEVPTLSDIRPPKIKTMKVK